MNISCSDNKEKLPALLVPEAPFPSTLGEVTKMKRLSGVLSMEVRRRAAMKLWSGQDTGQLFHCKHMFQDVSTAFLLILIMPCQGACVGKCRRLLLRQRP